MEEGAWQKTIMCTYFNGRNDLGGVGEGYRSMMQHLKGGETGTVKAYHLLNRSATFSNKLLCVKRARLLACEIFDHANKSTLESIANCIKFIRDANPR